MKRFWFQSFLSRISNKWGANSEAELAQIIQELERIATSEDSGARETALARFKDFIGRHPERADEIKRLVTNKMEALHVARERLMLDDDRKVDLSHFARDFRVQMGWPPTGSVRELDGDPAIKLAIDEIEQHRGKLTLREASRIMAVLDPESPEAAFFRWEAKK